MFLLGKRSENALLLNEETSHKRGIKPNGLFASMQRRNIKPNGFFALTEKRFDPSNEKLGADFWAVRGKRALLWPSGVGRDW